MKKSTDNRFSLAVVTVFLVAGVGIASAVETPVSDDEGRLRAEITMLNAQAGLPQGEKVILEQLSENFDVSSSTIKSLFGRMQLGDIAATLAFAETMPGGPSDANIERIADMRSKAMAWDQIADSLNVELGKVAGRLSSFEDSAHNGIKQAYAELFSAGSAAGGGIHGGTMGEMEEGMPGGATGGTGTNGDIHGGGNSGSKD